LPYYTLIAAVLVLMIAVKLAKFVGTLAVLALVVIFVTLKKRSGKR